MLSRSPQAFRASHAELLRGLNVRFHEGDILRPETLPRDGDFTHVLHAATDSTNGLTLSAAARFAQIVEGSRHVFDMMVRLGVRRVLLTSSGGAYGAQPAGLARVPEDYTGMPDPLNPQNAYSVGKRMVEHLGALYADQHGLEPVIARCFAFVGEDLPLDAHFAIGNFMRDALEGKDITVSGDGTAIRSYLDQRDLAHWLSVVLLEGQPLRAYNVGSDSAISIVELARVIARLGGSQSCEVRVQCKPEASQSAQRNRYVPDVSRAREELGLHVQIGLEAAIEYALARHRAGSNR